VFGEGRPEAGPCCQALRKAIDDVLRGKVAGPEGWCVPVQEPVEVLSEKGQNGIFSVEEPIKIVSEKELNGSVSVQELIEVETPA